MKPIININNMTKFFGDKVLFEDINIVIDSGKYALIWPNWCGKSTLINCILNSDQCSYGSTSIKWLYTLINQELPDKYYNFTVGEYFRQFLDDDEERRIGVILDELNLDVNESDYISNLSGWMKRKLELAKLLMRDRDVVIMDEPTNHLDINIRNRLIEWVDDYKWLVLCVTHDRDLINTSFDKILEIRDHKIYIYYGDYEDYLTSRAEEHENQLKAHDIYMRQKSKEEKLLATIRQRASIYDSPKRWALLKARKKYLERFINNNHIDKPNKSAKTDIKIAWWSYAQKTLLQVKNLSQYIYGRQLFEWISFKIQGSSRLLISWPNGSGKSTLLNYIVSILSQKTRDDKISFANWLKRWYFDQNNVWVSGDISAIDRLSKAINITDYQILRWKLANISIKWNEINTKVNELSYWQKVKLKFLVLMSQSIDLLIMDEPTNHLDIPTIESLEKMLADYKWAVILVCHDIYFVDQIWIEDILTIS